MNYEEAKVQAAMKSKLDECEVYIGVTLILHENGLPPTINEEGYALLDWCDYSVCATYVNGEPKFMWIGPLT